MFNGSTDTIATSTARTLLAIVAVISLAFSVVAIAGPTLANDHAGTDVQQSTPASSDGDSSASPSASESASPSASESASPSASESASPSASESASPSASESASPSAERDVTVMVMKHNCANVTTEGEFEAVEARAATNPTTPDAAFGPTVETVLECPTVVLDGDVQTPGAVAGGTSAYDFTVADGSSIQTLSTDGDFSQVGACETDVAYDATRNGTLDADVCLDLSHYGFDVEDGAVTITETEAPAGFSFGALRFTPGSGDSAALISAEAGVIVLDTTADSDGMIMLHVYNFADAAEESPSPTASEEPDRDVTVMVMKHNCANVTTEGEFEAVEARAATNPTTPDAAFGPTVETVLECPTVVLDGDVQTPGAVAGGTSAYDFTVADGSSIQTLSTDGDFSQVGACETDVAYDATRNGTLDADVCLDLSHYGFDVEDGAVTITETEAPAGFSFGALRFTPGSGDNAALISAEAGVIVLDTTADTDGMIMLHVYNFADAAEESVSPSASESASPSESPRESELGGNPTPAAGGNLPDTATGGPASPLVPMLALIALASFGLVARRSLASVMARR